MLGVDGDEVHSAQGKDLEEVDASAGARVRELEEHGGHKPG